MKDSQTCISDRNSMKRIFTCHIFLIRLISKQLRATHQYWTGACGTVLKEKTDVIIGAQEIH